MINLVSVYREKHAITILYDLLKERTPEQSISHRAMPTMEQHADFVRSQPYHVWYLIQNENNEYVGSVYLTHQREIGIFIFEKYQRNGYALEAVKEIMKLWPGEFLANVNPKNNPSIELFKKLGGEHIQNTYRIPS